MTGDDTTYPPVLGAMSGREAESVLRELGEPEAADVVAAGAEAGNGTYAGGLLGLLPSRAWAHTSHVFGHIPPGRSGPAEILHPGQVEPDRALAGAHVTVSLDRLRIADYPGRGTHQVLFDFHVYGEASAADTHSHHFSVTHRVREGEAAAVVGQPLFVELPVPATGLGLRCYTVNVRNEEDERLLAFLDSPAFRLGLRIGSSVHPAVGMVGRMTTGLTKALAERRRNVAVQDFHLGLGFSDVATRAGLAEGSYLAVQVPQAQEFAWEWEDWRYHPATGHVAHADDPSYVLPYNHLVLGVSRAG